VPTHVVLAEPDEGFAAGAGPELGRHNVHRSVFVAIDNVAGHTFGHVREAGEGDKSKPSVAIEPLFFFFHRLTPYPPRSGCPAARKLAVCITNLPAL